MRFARLSMLTRSHYQQCHIVSRDSLVELSQLRGPICPDSSTECPYPRGLLLPGCDLNPSALHGDAALHVGLPRRVGKHLFDDRPVAHRDRVRAAHGDSYGKPCRFGYYAETGASEVFRMALAAAWRIWISGRRIFGGLGVHPQGWSPDAPSRFGGCGTSGETPLGSVTRRITPNVYCGDVSFAACRCRRWV